MAPLSLHIEGGFHLHVNNFDVLESGCSEKDTAKPIHADITRVFLSVDSMDSKV